MFLTMYFSLHIEFALCLVFSFDIKCTHNEMHKNQMYICGVFQMDKLMIEKIIIITECFLFCACP